MNQSSAVLPPPLSGVKVLELSHLIAAPYCGMLLADEGAEVIKVDPPQGELAWKRDPLRSRNGETVSAHFASVNRGKKSVALNLKNPEGIRVFRELLGIADVLVTNMRGAALGRMGLHPKTLHEQFPRLISVSITGFGLENSGAQRDLAGLAMVAEGMTGTTGLTKDHAGNAVWCGFPLGDILAGMTAHSAILLALRDQEKFGRGRFIDLSLVECTLPMVGIALARTQFSGNEPSAAGSNAFHGVPYGSFAASDGFVNIGANSDLFWQRCCVAFGRPELGTDPRYAKYLQRVERKSEVHEIVEAFTSTRTRREIVEALNKVDVPAIEVLSTDEVLRLDYYKNRGSLRPVADGLGGSLDLPIDPTGFGSRAPVVVVPRLGEHTGDVLRGYLRYTDDDISRVEKAGAFETETKR